MVGNTETTTTLEGKSAFITGAAQGLGQAIAHAMHAAGARVVLADISKAAKEVARAIPYRTIYFFSSLQHGIAPAALQPITPNQMRAQVSALYLFVVSLLGLGLGPTCVALLTDYVYGEPAMVGYSTATLVAAIAPISIVIIAVGLKYYRRSLAAAEAGWQPAMRSGSDAGVVTRVV